MNNAQWTRYEDWRDVQNDLIQSDCEGCINLPAWFNQWDSYVKNGGDRPPVKPPKP